MNTRRATRPRTAGPSRAASGLALLLAVALPARAGGLRPWDDGSSATPAPPWHVAGLPLQTKPFTRFDIVELEGRCVLRVQADRSYGSLVQRLPPGEDGRYLRWRWRVDIPNEHTDLRRRSGDDTAAELCVMFDLPLQALSLLDRQLVRVARQHSPELLPTAAVCYVWDSRIPPGTVLDNAFTRRIRMIVLRGAGVPPGTWHAEQRDVRADFLQLFADEASEMPPIIGIGIGADADNTQTHTLSYISDLTLAP